MMGLWPHQQRALDQIAEEQRNGYSRICVASPTGSGKSRMMFESIKSAKRVAVYTDRRMLFDQIAKGLGEQGIPFGMRASGKKQAALKDVQLCMVQTETSRVIKGANDIHDCDTVLIDEAHKNGGDSMMQLIDRHIAKNPNVQIVGFTATPLGIGHAYDQLVIAAKNSELRDAGILVPSYHYGPDEPDQKWIGKVAIDGGECGIANNKRMEYAHRVFGRVVENYEILNPERRPSILFAPGVKESQWFAEHLSEQGIPSAHIDGENCWVDGVTYPSDADIRAEILDRLATGEIAIVCNRFVLREGIDIPVVSHGIFATVFGSLTSYLQAGGRFLRSAPGTGKDRCTIQDHGGNWYRFGSLNSDREWILGRDDRVEAGIREQRMRDKKDAEPIVCPNCHAIRSGGPACLACKEVSKGKSRQVLQADGTLREAKGDIFRERRTAKATVELETQWASRVRAVQNSKKESVRRMTFNQLENSFARDHKWQYPPRTLPLMPKSDADWFRAVSDVPFTELTR
jgi:superfamily II DNA or RNA helicase